MALRKRFTKEERELVVKGARIEWRVRAHWYLGEIVSDVATATSGVQYVNVKITAKAPPMGSRTGDVVPVRSSELRSIATTDSI